MLRQALRNRFLVTISNRSVSSFESKVDRFYETFDTKIDKEKFNLLLSTEYIDQGLNMQQPVPSLIMDHLTTLISTKEVYEVLGYFLNRFRRSIFGFKTRPWTIFILAKKGLDLGCEETLVSFIENADDFGFFLDSLGVKYVLEELLKRKHETLAVRVAVHAALKDMIDDSNVASLCAKTILTSEIPDSIQNKEIYFALRNLSLFGDLKSIYPYALAGIQLELENITKVDYHMFNPHMDTKEKLGKYLTESETEALSDLESILKTATEKINLDFNMAGSDEKFIQQITEWTDYSNKLHNVYGDLLRERIDFKTKYFEEEKVRMAGIEYALEQTGLYQKRDDLISQRNREIITPYFIANDFGLICVSDFELEQTVYEADQPDEWKKIDQFFQKRVNDIKDIADEADYYQAQIPTLKKTERTNKRWDENREVFQEFTKPDRLPKLPIE